MNLSLYELRLILVVILCIPVVYFGVRFVGSLMDQALAGRVKSGSGGKKAKRRRYGDEDEDAAR
ncbi:MAG: hypothetical protein LBN12_07645 [Clostridiales Family XIII bacterium]|jgi:hypothetical protein|nr:hypothetical protein [Clostridiales Family XIII bacterium]